jgi:alcohol dehydrogenase class IV
MGLLNRVLFKETLSFENSRLPRLMVGEDCLLELPRILAELGGKNIALITGGSSYDSSGYRKAFEKSLSSEGIEAQHFQVSGEPSPGMVDSIRDECLARGVEAVAAVGGGSVLDTAKAVAAMVRHPGSVKDYLEGVGDKKPFGLRLPLVAVPATSGTGSEATSNAVLSEVGPKGFKKSFRHPAFIPDLALIDPKVSRSCPPDLTAAAGMDAMTQLLEAFVSTKATPFTDMLAYDGLIRIGRALPKVVRDGENLSARSQAGYAAYLSGVVLANAGLGLVHGIASPMGALRHIPHGVVCGTLLPPATERIIKTAEEDEVTGSRVLRKYAAAAVALTGTDRGSLKANTAGLIELFYRMADEYEMPRLGSFGFREEELALLAERSSLKATPVQLSKEDLFAIMKARL